MDDARRTTHGQRLRAKGSGGWARYRVQGARFQLCQPKLSVISEAFCDLRSFSEGGSEGGGEGWVSGSGWTTHDARLTDKGSGQRVLGAGFMVHGSRFHVSEKEVISPGQPIMKSQLDTRSLRVTRSGTKQSPCRIRCVVPEGRNSPTYG